MWRYDEISIMQVNRLSSLWSGADEESSKKLWEKRSTSAMLGHMAETVSLLWAAVGSFETGQAPGPVRRSLLKHATARIIADDRRVRRDGGCWHGLYCTLGTPRG